MSDSTSIADQTKFIRDTLQAWLVLDGKAFVAADAVHAWNLVFQKSTGLRVIVLYNGENARNNFEGGSITGRVDRKFLVIVTRGRGFAAERGDTLTETVGNAEPLYNLVEQARDVCRSLVFDWNFCENPIDYIGIVPFPVPPELIVDAYQVEFSVGTQLGLPAGTPGNPSPNIT